MIGRVDQNRKASGTKVRVQWKSYCVGGLVFAILYFLSIGPLAWLEVNGYGNRIFWQQLRVVYTPVFASWQYGPEWCGELTERYLHNFSPRQRVLHNLIPRHGPYLFALPNQVQVERLWEAIDGVDLINIPFEDRAPLGYPSKASWESRKLTKQDESP